MNDCMINSTDNSVQKENFDLPHEMLDIYTAVAEEQFFKYDVKQDILVFIGAKNGLFKSDQTINDFMSEIYKNDVIAKDNVDTFLHSFRQLFIMSKKSSIEFRSSFFENSLCWYRADCKSIDENGRITCIIGRIYNINHEKSIIESIKETAETDSLTRLLNFNGFCAKSTPMLENDTYKNGILIIAEILDIASVEEYLGYEYADAYIRRFAESLRKLYSNDYIIGRDKERFFLLSKRKMSKDLIKADCEGIIGFVRTSDIDSQKCCSVNVNIGISNYPENGINIRSLISEAEKDLFKNLHQQPGNIKNGNQIRISSDSLIGDSKTDENYAAQFISLMDRLFKFVDIMFYNFQTLDITQSAFSLIADDFDICGVTLRRIQRGHYETPQVLYSVNYEIDEDTPFEEYTMHSILDEVYIYKIYRRSGSVALSPRKQKALRFVSETLHTYMNRFSSMETAKYAQTHDIRFGCLNAMGFKEKLNSIRNTLELSEYAVIFMNIKRYKSINAKVGFERGNAVLHTVVDSLRLILDENETFARTGGDNFFVFVRKENIEQRIEKINNLSCEINVNDIFFKFEINFRMGIYMIEPNVRDAVEIIENASIAFGFTRQKRDADIVYYTNESRIAFEQRKILESSLKPALENGEFLVYFQPKVSLENYHIVGAEALTRWMKNGKIMPPMSFIPIFEQNGMIYEIDFYVYESVCHSIRNWIDNGIKPVIVSVNFSKVTLETPGFIERIKSIAKKYDTPIEYLEIEFTETCCMENDRKFRDLLKQLKENGFSASLDDFGTGYSSINMLKNMDFNVLKLDKSFIADDKANDEREKVILKNIISMAKELKLEVISEGVETIEQINYLKQLKCEQAQGYFFDKPLPRDKFEERLLKECYLV